MKKIIFAVFMLFSLPLWAGASIDVSKLDQSQINALQTQVTALEQKKAMPVELTMMERAVELGKMLGAGIGATAKELGIAVDEFSQTTPGRLAMFILFWKFVGQGLLSILLGIVITIAGPYVAWRMIRTGRGEVRNRTYELTPILWGLVKYNRCVKVEDRMRSISDQDVFLQAAGYIMFAISLIVGLNCVF